MSERGCEATLCEQATLKLPKLADKALYIPYIHCFDVGLEFQAYRIFKGEIGL